MKTMLRTRALWVVAILAWLPLGAGHAAQIEDDEAIDIDLRSASLVETLTTFAQITGRELDIHPSIHGSVTIHLKKVPWRTAINQVCEQQDLLCELLEGEPPILRVMPVGGARPPLESGLVPLLDMSLRGADLRETLRAFGAITGHQVTFDDAATGKVTLFVSAIPWQLLMEEVCDLAGCRVQWGGDTIHIAAAEKGQVSPRRSDLVLDGALLSEAFEIAASLPLFGPFGSPEVRIGEGLGGWADVDLDDASYVEIFNAICQQAGCSWSFRYGVPSRVEVTPADTRLSREVTLLGGDATLASAAAELAALVDLEARLGTGLDGEAKVRLDGGPAPWGRAMHQLCRQAICGWRIEDQHLVLDSRIEPLATRPLSGTRGVDLEVRFTPAGDPAAGGEVVTDTAHFQWAGPVHTLISEGPEPRLVRLVWIPFAADFHVVVPILARCTEAGLSELEVGDPLRLPVSGTWSARFAGGLLEIGNPVADEDRRGGSAARHRQCLPGPTGKLEASFVLQDVSGREPEGEPRHERLAATLFNRLGAYLLITPPGGRPEPVAAVVTLGIDDDGGQQLALIRPAEGGGVAVDHHLLTAGQKLVETLPLGGGDTLDLMLRFVELDP